MTSGQADLHLHTFYSDGTDAPEQVVEHVKASGLSAMAITDHDNTEALAIAAPVAQRLGLQLISGIEMSASTDEADVHLLGFLIDPEEPMLKQHLAEQQARRVRRVHEVVARLAKVGVTLDVQEILDVAGQGTVGRPHVARVLLKHGYISKLSDAFTKYIGPKNAGYVPGSPIAPARVIQVIRGAGGVPVLAHPVYLKNDALIEEFVAVGLAGIEVYHSGHGPKEIRRYEEIATRLNLVKTGGSDYHGESREGQPVGSSRVPCAFIDALKSWQQQHRSTSVS